ncbi:MAG: hypothetical protein R3304_03515 [Longimicrobiales bacterium]|nr:hypothetical protein [Longimicrobiales bacterium]
MRRPRRPTPLLVALTLASACDVPRFEGPQIQDPPTGFTLQPERALPPRTFPERDVLFHTAWGHTGLSGSSVIHVDGHPGAMSRGEVMEAREDAIATAEDPDAVFDPVEALRIDGREAWGWYERVESPRRGLVEVAYRAVVPYDTLTYAIEVRSGEPTLKGAAPDTLRSVVSTFGVGRTTYNVPVILVALGAVLFVVGALRTRARAARSDTPLG